MNNKLILVVLENCELYRLNMYHDFVDRLSIYHSNVKIYGEGYQQADPKYIKSYSPSKTIHDIIRDDLGGQEPDIVFFINAQIAPSDFTRLKSKVYVFLSDSVSTNQGHVRTVNSHKFSCEGVFHNYLYEQDLIVPAFNAKHKFFWPCWSAMKYDYEKHLTPKSIDFFMSGTITGEYAYRQIFRDIFRGSNLNFADRYKQARNTDEDNQIFLEFLGKSRYSPHDGGVNGRMQGRFYESSFMKSIVIAPDLGEEMRKNGFEHGINSILFDRSKPIEQVKDMLKKIDSYDWTMLSNNAYNLIKSRHTTDHRIKSFLDVVLN